MVEAKSVLSCGAELGEGPLWVPEEGLLYWLNITQGEVHWYSPATGEDRMVRLGQPIGSMCLRKSGGFLAALEAGFYYLTIEDKKVPRCTLKPIDDPEADIRDNRFNDGACGPDGAFWAGTMNTAAEKRMGAASLYRLGPSEGEGVTKVLEGVTISNGITWSLDEETMYYIDTFTREIWAFDFNTSNGALKNRRTVVRVPENEGMPDGMTRDEEGNLWAAHWGGGKVICWDPLTGKKLREVLVPAPHTTSCAFGGPQLDELYITTARTGLSEEVLDRYPLSGDLFRVKPGFKGLPPYRFGPSGISD